MHADKCTIYAIDGLTKVSANEWIESFTLEVNERKTIRLGIHFCLKFR